MLFADSAFCTTPFATAAARTWNLDVSETAQAQDAVAGVSTIPVSINETAQGADSLVGVSIIPVAIAETLMTQLQPLPRYWKAWILLLPSLMQ
jgi:hypothetical protein